VLTVSGLYRFLTPAVLHAQTFNIGEPPKMGAK
jgi:hypothetical protein